MKMTLITNSKGELVGSIQGSATEYRTLVSEKGEQTQISLGLLPTPDQKFTECDVPDELVRCEAHELHEHLKTYLGKSK
jgi:hypothetical protein